MEHCCSSFCDCEKHANLLSENVHETQLLPLPQTSSLSASVDKEKDNEVSNFIDLEQTIMPTEELKSLIEIKLDNELVLAGLLSSSAMSDLTTSMLIHARSFIEGSQIILTKSGAILVLSEKPKDELSERLEALVSSFKVEFLIENDEYIFPTISAVLAFTDRGGATVKELYYAADQLIETFSNSDTHRNKKRKTSSDSNGGQEESLRGARFEMCELI